jgi:hypothetical protein
MNRRDFLATGVGGAVGLGAAGWPQVNLPANGNQEPTGVREMVGSDALSQHLAGGSPCSDRQFLG